MIKSRYCPECNVDSIYDFYCDYCGKDLIKNFLGVPITVDYSCGHDLDGTINHFCDNECLIKFHQDEMSKQNPNNPFITGKEN